MIFCCLGLLNPLLGLLLTCQHPPTILCPRLATVWYCCFLLDLPCKSIEDCFFIFPAGPSVLIITQWGTFMSEILHGHSTFLLGNESSNVLWGNLVLDWACVPGPLGRTRFIGPVVWSGILWKLLPVRILYSLPLCSCVHKGLPIDSSSSMQLITVSMVGTMPNMMLLKSGCLWLLVSGLSSPAIFIFYFSVPFTLLYGCMVALCHLCHYEGPSS